MFDYVKSIRSRAYACTPAQFDAIVDDRRVAEACAEIEDARERYMRGEMQAEDFKTFKAERKKSLPGFCFQAHFDGNGRRLDQNAMPSGLAIYDKDHIKGDPRQWFAQHVEAHIGNWQIVLAHVTPSMEGVRLVFRVAKDVRISDAQYSLAKALGDDDYDGSVKDLARLSYAVPRSYIIHIDHSGLFEATADEYVMPFKIVRAKGEKQTKRAVKKAGADIGKTNAGTQAGDGGRWRCKSPSERTMAIIERGMQKRNINRKSFAIEGQRHFMLVNLLSTGIARLLTREELMGAIKKIAPPYSKEDDCWQLVADWYANYANDNKPVSRDFAWTFADILNAGAGSKPTPDKPEEETEEAEVEEAEIKKPSEGDIKLDVDKMPDALKHSLSHLPEAFRMPVACAIMPLAGAYADQVQVRYCDGKMQHLGLMSIIVGEQASNKSFCRDAVDLWIRQMNEEDAAQRKIEDEWKARRKNRKANEKGEPDPCVLVRQIPVTTSCSTLLRRIKNSRGHCLYSFGEELDTLRKTNGAGSWSSKYDVYRLSFDRGLWGQDYNSDQAESGMVSVAYNWSILGTYGAFKKCFGKDNVENGLSSRMMVAEMPDNRFAPLTSVEPPSEEAAPLIQAAVETLRSTTGFVDTPRLRDAMAEWVEQRRIEALQSIDNAKDTFRKRAAVIGFRCGAVYSILADGETDDCIAFARTMADYTLKMQCKLFGPFLVDEQEMGTEHNNVNIFTEIPGKFGIAELRLIKGQSCSDATLRQTISRWKRSGWIMKTSPGVWSKIL